MCLEWNLEILCSGSNLPTLSHLTFPSLLPPLPPLIFLSQGVAKQLIAGLRRGLLPQESQHDCVVDLICIVARSDAEFAMSQFVMELLRSEGLTEAKVPLLMWYDGI